MARTALTVASVAPYSDGLAITMESADQANGNSAANDGLTVLYIENADGSEHTCTVTAVAGPANYNEAFTKTRTIALTTGKSMMGPFPFQQFGSSLLIDWDSDTSVTVKAVSLASAIRTPRA